MNNITPYSKATQYLNSVSLSDANKIKLELEEMQKCVQELNPQNPNSETISSRRVRMLEEKIEDLFKAIALKLTPSDVAWSTIDTLCKLSQIRTSMSPKEFRSELKKLPENVRNKLYGLIWIASGFPDEQRFPQRLLDQDNSILANHFPALLGENGGTLIEQLILELKLEDKLNNPKYNVNQLIQGKLNCFYNYFTDQNRNRHQLKAIFNMLPKAAQDALRNQGYQPPFYGKDLVTDLHKTLGAHYNHNTRRTTFRVYAPNAHAITLNLTAFGQVKHAIPMQKGNDGVWSIETPQAQLGCSYHYMVTGNNNNGEPVKKVDPFAFQNLIHNRYTERNNHESIVYEMDKAYAWHDKNWVDTRQNRHPATTPMHILEIHPSWKKKSSGEFYNWRDLAPELAGHCKYMGYNAIELMGLFSHPQHISMGYQISNYFAPNCEMGTWEDFQYFVDYMHKEKITVIADWVPSHFATDTFGLCEFDGSALFESDNPKYATHPTWGTRVFDLEKKHTQEFLASNAHFLFEMLHIDAMRIDAVTSMLDLNFYRPEFERKNYLGSKDNLSAKSFFRNLNTHLHDNYPGALIIAEESDAYPNLTRSPYERGKNQRHGIGFDLTWHMGWMNDTLKYWKISVYDRTQNGPFPPFGKLVHSVQGVDGNEDSRPRGSVVLPYSHDEVSKGEKTLLDKLSTNDRSEKFANGRLMLAYQSLRGGGPTLDFMGNEILQSDEWHGRLIESTSRDDLKCKASVQWEDLDPNVNKWEHWRHKGAMESRRELNHLILSNPGFHDQKDSGFAWVHVDEHNAVLSFVRKGQGQQFICVFNSAGRNLKNYLIPLPSRDYMPELDGLRGMNEVYNTDHKNYGGEGRTNNSVRIIRDNQNRPVFLELDVPPLTAIVLEELF